CMTQRLNSALGPAAVWASTRPLLEGAVASATTCQTLPSPMPVLAAIQPAGSLPRLSLVSLHVRGSTAATDVNTDRITTVAQVMPRMIALLLEDTAMRPPPGFVLRSRRQKSTTGKSRRA